MIEIKIHSKVFPGSQFQLSLDLIIPKGSLAVIYGSSGSGKTTIMRILAGLLKPESGRIICNEDIWLDTEQNVCRSAQDRRIGFVFQDYALFPNMTVFENIQFAMQSNKKTSLLNELLDVMELRDFKDRLPGQLSGGQKQRVALARAIAYEPVLLMLDEPLAALDNRIRESLQDKILDLHKRFDLTTIMVTHDIGEIFKMSNYVIHIEDGKIQKHGKASDIFTGGSMKGKVAINAQILAIDKSDVVNIVTLLVGNDVIKIVSAQTDDFPFNIGEKVLVAANAFNPMLHKLGD